MMHLKSILTKTLLPFLILSPSNVLAQTSPDKAEQFTTPVTFRQIDDLRREFYCPPEQHQKRKLQLKTLQASDQSDRENNRADMSSNDLERRKNVSDIAAEGCLIEQDDYWTASIIYQHGLLSEHYLQATIYANKSASLGSKRALGLREVTIDRYLMSLGKAQLFGSQIVSPSYYKPVESEADLESCLWPIDGSFDVLQDYDVETVEYRRHVKARIEGLTSDIGFCDFPAEKSKHLLPLLLALEI